LTQRPMPLLGLIQQRGRPERLQHAPLREDVPMGLHLRRPEKGLRQSPTEVLQRQDPPLSLGQEVEDSGESSRILGRAAGHSANQAILEDNIETFKGQGLV
jgi:hypothetical protein